MTVTLVQDDEVLYRAVRAGSNEYRIEQGILRIAASAFNDIQNKPSVDRSSMRGNPGDTRFTSTDGIASLVSRDVRAIATVSAKTPDGKLKFTYKVDVMHRPIEKSATETRDNPAHCQIECDPDITNTHYKKLKEALALLATKRGWIISPVEGAAAG